MKVSSGEETQSVNEVGRISDTLRVPLGVVFDVGKTLLHAAENRYDGECPLCLFNWLLEIPPFITLCTSSQSNERFGTRQRQLGEVFHRKCSTSPLFNSTTPCDNCLSLANYDSALLTASTAGSSMTATTATAAASQDNVDATPSASPSSPNALISLGYDSSSPYFCSHACSCTNSVAAANKSEPDGHHTKFLSSSYPPLRYTCCECNSLHNLSPPITPDDCLKMSNCRNNSCSGDDTLYNVIQQSPESTFFIPCFSLKSSASPVSQNCNCLLPSGGGCADISTPPHLAIAIEEVQICIRTFLDDLCDQKVIKCPVTESDKLEIISECTKRYSEYFAGEMAKWKVTDRSADVVNQLSSQGYRLALSVNSVCYKNQLALLHSGLRDEISKFDFLVLGIHPSSGRRRKLMMQQILGKWASSSFTGGMTVVTIQDLLPVVEENATLTLPNSVTIWFGTYATDKTSIATNEVILAELTTSTQLPNKCFPVDLRIAHLSQLPPLLKFIQKTVNRNNHSNPKSTQFHKPPQSTPLSSDSCTEDNVFCKPIYPLPIQSASSPPPTHNFLTLRSLKESFRNSNFSNAPVSIPLSPKSVTTSPLVVCYLFVPAKAHRFHIDGLLDFSDNCIFVPLFPQISLELQIKSLTVLPDAILFKLSDYLACPRALANYRILKELTKLTLPSRRQNNSTEKIAAQLGDGDSCCQSVNQITVLTPLRAQKMMLDRVCFLAQLNTVCDTLNDFECCRVARHASFDELPSVVDISQTLNSAGLSFPLLCKSRMGGGPAFAHELATVYSVDGIRGFAEILCKKRLAEEERVRGEQIPDAGVVPNLFQSKATNADKEFESDLEWLTSPIPPGIIVQEFVPHDDCVFKVFVLGDHIDVTCHQSLPNPLEAQFTDFCRSIRPSQQQKAENDSHHVTDDTSGSLDNFVTFNSIYLKKVKMQGKNSPRNDESNLEEYPSHQLDMIVVKRICDLCSKAFNTELFGLDILVMTQTNTLVLVDINFFPSYNQFPDLKERFHKFIMTRGAPSLSTSLTS